MRTFQSFFSCFFFFSDAGSSSGTSESVTGRLVRVAVEPVVAPRVPGGPVHRAVQEPRGVQPARRPPPRPQRPVQRAHRGHSVLEEVAGDTERRPDVLPRRRRRPVRARAQVSRQAPLEPGPQQLEGGLRERPGHGRSVLSVFRPRGNQPDVVEGVATCREQVGKIAIIDN